MSPEQIGHLKLLTSLHGYSVTFCPIDHLNPQIGLACLIEGEFGRVSGDSPDSLSEAFFNATEQLSKALQGVSSNVRPVLSLNQQVAAMTDSQLEALAAHILTIQAERSVPIP